MSRSRLIYLSSNHTSPDPLQSTWTARWDGIAESGRSAGEAVDAILRHAPDGRVGGLALIIRAQPESIDFGATNDRRPKRRRAFWPATPLLKPRAT